MKQLGFKAARFMSRISKHMLWVFVGITVFVAVAALFQGTPAGRFIGNIFSPLGMSRFLNGEEGCWLTVLFYLIGLFLFTGLFISLITNYMRDTGDRYKNGTLKRYHWKGHVLFLGYDELMLGTLRQACEGCKRVVVAMPGGVDATRNILDKYFDSEMMKRLEVVQCHQTDLAELRTKACIDKAVRIYIIGMTDEPTHDAQNLKSLALIADHLKENAEVPRIMVYLRNQSTFSLLQRQGFNAENLWKMIDKEASGREQTLLDRYCEYFNFHCDKALRLLTAGGLHPGWPSDRRNLHTQPGSQVHLVVIGMTPMGTALVREAIKLAHPSGKGTRFRVTMVDPNAYEQMHYFVGRTKELFKRCHYTFTDFDRPDRNSVHVPEGDFLDVEFEFICCDVAHPRLNEAMLRWACDPKRLLTLALCTNSSPQNMAVAMYLPWEMLGGDNAVPVWIYQDGDDSMKQLLAPTTYPHLHPFSLSDHAVEDISMSPTYAHAREIAKRYNSLYGDKAGMEWDDTPASDRWSSIYNVLSMSIKMKAVGGDDILLDNEDVKLSIDIIEHNRWVVEKLSAGFVPTDEQQHQHVAEELNALKQRYPNWGTDRTSREQLEKERKVFKELKTRNIHDDIRAHADLDDYTRRKDRLLLNNYLACMEKR